MTSGARWTGWSGFMLRVCWGRVLRRRWMVCTTSLSAVVVKRRGKEVTNPLDYPCSDSCYVAFDYLVSWCAEHQGASRVYRRKQRIAVFETMFEVGERFAEFLDEPVEFAFLSRRTAHKGRVN